MTRRGSPRGITVLSLAVLAFLAASAVLVARPADVLSPAAEAQARTVRDAAAAIREAELSARTLGTEIDAVLRNLDHPGAQARGAVPGWEARLERLRSAARAARAARAALRLDVLEAEREDPEAARALRTAADLDRRLQRLDAAVRRAAQSLQALQARLREPEPPAAEPEKHQPPGPVKPSEVVDLSGTWIASGDATGGRREEWEIRHDPAAGTITISVPWKPTGGRLDYTGTTKGETILTRYQVTAPEVLNPNWPAKVREAHAARRPVWSLKLKVRGPDRLEGTDEAQRVTYDRKTQKITAVEPYAAALVLERKGAEAVAKPPLAKRPPDGEEPPPTPRRLEELANRARNASERAERLHREAVRATDRRDANQRALEEAEARAREARERERQEEARLDRRRVQELEGQIEMLEGLLRDLDRRIHGMERHIEELRTHLRQLGTPEWQLETDVYEERTRLGYQRLRDERISVSERAQTLREEVRRLTWRVKGARWERERAERKLEGLERNLREAEQSAEDRWERYERASSEAYHAVQDYLAAKSRAQAAPRPSP